MKERIKMKNFNLEIYEWNELYVIISYNNGDLKINFIKKEGSFNFNKDATLDDIIYFLKSRIATGVNVLEENLIDFLKENEGRLMTDTIRLKFN